MRALVLTSLLVALGIFSAHTTAQAEDANMRVAALPYSECLSIIAEAAEETGEAPVQMVNNDE